MDFGLIFTVLGTVSVIVLGGIGSSIGVSLAAQAAAGVLTEDPEKFGKMIPLIGIPGTQGFYSLLIGFMMLGKLGLLSAAPKIPTASVGLQLFLIGFVVGWVELFSAIYQGKAAVGAIGIIAKKPQEAGKALILPAFVEIYAVLGLVAGFLLLQSVKI